MFYAMGMNALVTVCSWNTNVSMVWARMLLRPYALGTRAILWFGQYCGDRVLLKHERYYGLGMDAAGNRTQRRRMLSWSSHGCSAQNAMRGGSTDF